MPRLEIHDLPVELYDRLVTVAKLDKCSLEQKATDLLAQALRSSSLHRERRRALLADIKASGGRIKFPRGATPEQLIREDRESPNR